MTRTELARWKDETTPEQLKQWAEWLRQTMNAAKLFEVIETANVQGEGDAPLSGKEYELYIHACLRLTIAAEEAFRARKDIEHLIFGIEANAD